MFETIYSKISAFNSIFFSSHFVFNIAILVSKSGVPMSIIIPPSNLDLNLSSSAGMAFGGLSEDNIICLFDSRKALKI